MLINELSKRTGLSVHTLRYYENIGFFSGVADEKTQTNNYKHYDETLTETLALVKEAKEVGFTLAEIKNLLHIWKTNAFSTDRKKEVIAGKLKDIDAKVQQLKMVKMKLLKIFQDIENGAC